MDLLRQNTNLPKRLQKQKTIMPKKANTTDTGCSITVSKFDGRETIWSDMTDEAQDMEMDL